MDQVHVETFWRVTKTFHRTALSQIGHERGEREKPLGRRCVAGLRRNVFDTLDVETFVDHADVETFGG